METWKKDLENVIDKWNQKGPPSYLTDGVSKMPEPPGNGYNNVSSTGKRNYSQRNVHRNKHLKNRKPEGWNETDSISVPNKFKLIPPIVKPPRKTYIPFMCTHCRNLCSRGYLSDENGSIRTSNLCNILDVVSYSRGRWFTNMLIPHLGFAFSRKAHLYPVISPQKIAEAKPVLKAASEKEDIDQVGKNKSTIYALYKQIQANVSNRFLRLATWVLLKIFGRIFSNLSCQTVDIESLKLAAKKNIPIIYLPLHKSHLDYIILSLVLFCNDIRVPYTAAGDNLKGSSFIGFMLNKLGAFFIRRKNGDKNGDAALYNSILQEYIEELLGANQSLQVYIEGTRSRTGRAMSPKSGILSIITNAVSRGVVDDVYIVPVNICYEKVPECSSYAVELLGARKNPESFWQMIISLYRMMTSFNGQIYVGFGKPFSFEVFCEREERFAVNKSSSTTAKQNSTNSLFCCDESTVRLTRNLASHVISDCCNSGIITCTSMVSFLLVTKHRSGVSMDDLEQSFDWLKEEIANRNGYFGFTGSNQDVINYALDMLLGQQCLSINVKDAYIIPNKDDQQFFGLVFYSNQVTSLFFGEAIVACSIVAKMGGSSLVELGQSSADTISRVEVLSLAKSVCSLLIKECNISSPCKDADVVLSDLLDSFVSNGTLVGITSQTCDSLVSRRMADKLANWDDYGYDDDDDVDETEACFAGKTDVQYQVDACDENRASLIHLSSLVSPLLETYWLVAVSLNQFVGESSVEENDLIQSVHKLALGRVRKGLTQYVETASLVSVKNAILTLRSMEILVNGDTEIPDQKTLRISPAYLNQGSLDEFIHEINMCR